jgi:hypothetical protein
MMVLDDDTFSDTRKKKEDAVATHTHTIMNKS